MFGGVPGVGKTAIARPLARALRAVYLRVDTIEQAMRDAGVADVGPAGYAVANRLAGENLVLGRHVVADCANPVAASRAGWRQVSAMAGGHLAEIRMTCSDEAEHYRRLDTRVGDVPGLARVTWDMVERHPPEAWDDAPHLALDTAVISVSDAVQRCVDYVTARS